VLQSVTSARKIGCLLMAVDGLSLAFGFCLGCLLLAANRHFLGLTGYVAWPLAVVAWAGGFLAARIFLGRLWRPKCPRCGARPLTIALDADGRERLRCAGCGFEDETGRHSTGTTT